MNDRNLKIYWGIKQLKQCNGDNELSWYLQGCLDAGIKQNRLDKLIDKVNNDIK